MRYFSLGILLVASLFGMPKNPEVTAGGAKIEGMRIEAEDRTIIHWGDFSIEPDERVEFVQPSAEAAVLNRVVDAVPSRLMGRLESNGRVILVNPNGILVGKEGRIDVGAFIASSLDVLDRSFLEKGELAAREISWGLVANEGEIRGKEICLAGFEVHNHGEVVGERVGLVGAKEASIEIGVLVIRRGSSIEGLREKLGNPYRFAVVHPEDEDWPTVASFHGAKAEHMPGPAAIEIGILRGQEIQCLGDYIDVRAGATIEADGGQVWIGGKGTRIARLDGAVQAAGGRVDAWSDGAMRFGGSISAGSASVAGGVFSDLRGTIETLYLEPAANHNIAP